MIGRVRSQASERRTERSDGLNLLGLRSGQSRKSRYLSRAGQVIPPNPTRPARSHLWSCEPTIVNSGEYLYPPSYIPKFLNEVNECSALPSQSRLKYCGLRQLFLRQGTSRLRG